MCSYKSQECCSFTCCRSLSCSSTSHTFTHVGLSCRAVQTQAGKACPMPSPHCSLAQECSHDVSCHPSKPWTRTISLFPFCSSLHTPGTHWQEPVERDRFPSSEQPCRSPLLLARRRDRGGGFTNSSGIRLPKQSCGAQDDAQEHQPTTKRLCKPGARLS